MIYEGVESGFVKQHRLDSNIVESFVEKCKELDSILGEILFKGDYHPIIENAVGWRTALRVQRNAFEGLLAKETYSYSVYFLEGWWSLFVNWSSAIFLVLGFSVYLLTFSSKILANTTSGRDNLLTIYTYFDEWEEELGCLDDVVYYILLLALTIVWFYFFTLISAYIILKHINWLITVFTLVLISGLVIPGSVIINMGIYGVQYVRGSGRTSNIVFEILLDFISVSVIVIRFFIQNIRFVFIFLAFFELYEFTVNILFSDFKNFSVFSSAKYSVIFNGVESLYDCRLISYLITQWVLYLYYLGHLTLLFVVQLSIYFILSFWLFFFLYTTFILNPHEKYFLYKKLA